METMMMDIDTVHTTTIPHRPTKRTFKELQNEESSSESFPFLALPTELQYEVMTSVENPLDVLSISRACKQTNSLSKRESVWRNLCLSKWNDLKEKPSNWKRYFYERNTFLSSQAALMDWQDKSALPNPSNLPQPRQSFTGTCVNGKIIYIGGQTSVRVRFDDIYVFDPASRTFSKPNVRGNPPKFARHSAVAIGDKIYIFGGYDGFGSFFGLAVLDTINWSWEYPRVSGNAPIPRTNHAVTAIGSRMYMFGGNDTTSPEKDKLRCGTYDDFVYFETETSTWYKPITKGKSPCGRSGHHMVTIGGKIYLFGGGLWNDATKSWLERYNDMYQYDPVTNEWTELAVQNSPNFAFISLPHWTVGYFIFVYNDPVWCFDTITRTWHSLNTKGKKPQKRFLGPASYVQNFNTVFMFGGVYAEVINDFDMLSWPPSISLILQSESSDPESNI